MTVFRPTNVDSNLAEYMRELVRKSLELLKHPSPDTFAGRKTQGPFPSQDNEIERWLNSSGLQPPK